MAWRTGIRLLQRTDLILSRREALVYHGDVRQVFSTAARQWSTPLAKTIADAIATTGPISIAQYMRQCLTSDRGGYYTTGASAGELFGTKGDFITSPEISQIFGELMGIWMVAEWIAQGRRKAVEIIEVGPGRGTLMDDLLRTIRRFKTLSQSIDNVFLVEASPVLREKQKDILCGSAPLEQAENGFRCRSKGLGVPITWFEDLNFVPNDPSKTPFIFAHEFFDALPIHAFQSVSLSLGSGEQTLMTPTGSLPLKSSIRETSQSQWRELMVTPVPPSSTTTRSTASPTEPPGEFQLCLSTSPTPSSMLLPSLSDRYRAMLKNPNATIEISPQSHAVAADFARRIGGSSPTKASAPHSSAIPPVMKSTASGAALILDYGPMSTIPVNSLRGIQAHKLVSPFSAPGKVDLSADVDFTALAEAAINASEGVEVHGPVEQGAWLESMGIRERGEMLCRAIDKEQDQQDHEKKERKKDIRRGWERLTERGGGGMGRIYKVLSIVPENNGKRSPVGFGGAVP